MVDEHPRRRVCRDAPSSRPCTMGHLARWTGERPRPKLLPSLEPVGQARRAEPVRRMRDAIGDSLKLRQLPRAHLLENGLEEVRDLPQGNPLVRQVLQLAEAMVTGNLFFSVTARESVRLPNPRWLNPLEGPKAPPYR